jgi:hypothetical protein
MIAGVIMGPSLFGLLFPSWHCKKDEHRNRA